MKICVCSDSHGNSRGLEEMLRREQPRQVLFLGDGERDWNRVDLPQGTPFAAVCGNCDWMSLEPPFRILELGGRRIFMTHGHLYGAKQGLYGLIRQGQQHSASLVLYGHTHRARIDEEGGCTLLCPGSMGVSEQRYAVITLNGEAMELSLHQL